MLISKEVCSIQGQQWGSEACIGTCQRPIMDVFGKNY